jgi:hypothetical protein
VRPTTQDYQERASDDANNAILWKKTKNASHSTASQSMTVVAAATAAETQNRRETQKPAGKRVPAGKPVFFTSGL